ncbi:MAG: site-2 protease family protein [Sulfuricurvum sp.]|uniref:site-2 protease family protein n=1 Tax=Sulfuricurvum sp. TaxID=2025608 RepID=UPI00262130FA|nr:site-2 protease family protein [Sulfuricurvum sp.]MDD2369137.1 site-2 protease family protein [Sulfuricurvum sp.]MDD5119373.1 site-2 protease family protein [Sulfuricurvum sp.]
MKTLLALLAAGKLGKVALTGGSMLISIVAYSFIFGWWYAIGFVLLIFVHEMGHFIAARQRGLDVGAPTFIPFVGAWIALKEQPIDVENEAYIGFAGPFVGTLGALVVYYLSRTYDSNLLLALAYSGFFINLFNLIPISPLDGGRISAVLTPRIWFLGVPMLLGFFFYFPSPMLLVVAILAFPQLKLAWNYDPQDENNQRYYAISAENRLAYSLYYIGLVVFLSAMTYNIHQVLGRGY